MIEAPLGGAAFNNEFGRPNLAATSGRFEMEVPGPRAPEVRGYHKPIMVAGGLGNIRPEHVQKAEIPAGAAIVVLGGPAMLIGLGGGAASSLASGASQEDLDFASVQRDNAEMQRRCQEVIDRCLALGGDNPILSIHDVGAGGLSNALPELVHDSGRGARFELRDDPQRRAGDVAARAVVQRGAGALRAGDRARPRWTTFEALCARERCPYAVVGQATDDGRLLVEDSLLGDTPIDLPLDVLLGKPPRMTRDAARRRVRAGAPFATGVDPSGGGGRAACCGCRRSRTRPSSSPSATAPSAAWWRAIRWWGPGRCPVADAAVTATGFDVTTGEAMAMGERAPVALLDAAASARLAVAEAITNIACGADREALRRQAVRELDGGRRPPGEDARLYDAVRAVGVELAPALGIAIPVGKDSMSMRTMWSERGETRTRDRAAVAGGERVRAGHRRARAR